MLPPNVSLGIAVLLTIDHILSRLRGSLVLSVLSGPSRISMKTLAAAIRSSVTCAFHRQLLTDLEASGTDSDDVANAVWQELCGQNWRVRGMAACCIVMLSKERDRERKALALPPLIYT